MSTTITPDRHAAILRHALGLTNGNRRAYRNYFATAPGCTDWPVVQELVAAGLMVEGTTGYRITYFHVSAEGKQLLVEAGECRP